MKTHILGFPSIGKHRELKTALESFWKGTLSVEGLFDTCTELKKRHWKVQRDAGLSYVTTGDISLYDRMLDMTCMLGAVPSRFIPCRDAPYPARYFSLARGDAALNIPALEMTKWFDTNYHYLVPEIDGGVPRTEGEHPVLADTRLAGALGYSPKPALIGPFTWLALAKGKGDAEKWSFLTKIVGPYCCLLQPLSPLCDLIQIEEPVLCTDLLPDEAGKQFTRVYAALNEACGRKLMLTAYFGTLADSLALAAASGCAALHVDLVRGENELDDVLAAIPGDMTLSLGLVNGRNIWRTNYARAVSCIHRAVSKIGKDRVMLGTSCSLLHAPVDLSEETALPEYVKSRMAFAVQKCAELASLNAAVESGVSSSIEENAAVLKAAGEHPETRIDSVRRRTYVVMINEAVRDRPADMAVTMHICRGNFRSTWMTSGGYEPVAVELFGKARLSGFFLEYDTKRAGDFTPLRFIRDQQVVLGLVSSKTGKLESREELKKRIAEAAEFVPLNQLCLSPQCGFSSTEEGNILTEEEQWNKIRLVAETASEVW